MTHPNPPKHLKTAQQSVTTMLKQDAFSAWLGIVLVHTSPGSATITMVVRPEMLNGFGVCHGGVTFALADSALAFAAGTHGAVSVTIESTIAWTEPVHPGDQLTAAATQVHLGKRIGHYDVRITNQHHTLVGTTRGLVYRTQKPISKHTTGNQHE